MTTLDAASLACRRLTAVASPIPTAVPSSIIPTSSSPMSDVTTEWSSVSGACVKALPAKITTPRRSLRRPATKSAATALDASMRLGSRSSASIELEMSSASTMSIPSATTFSPVTPVWGRANATTRHTSANPRSAAGR